VFGVSGSFIFSTDPPIRIAFCAHLEYPTRAEQTVGPRKKTVKKLNRSDANMDDQALAKRVKALTKAVASDPPSVVIGLLEELKKEKAPTEEQLRVSLLTPGTQICGTDAHGRRAVHEGRRRGRQTAAEREQGD
jgi:hypothetical protein